MKKNFFYAILSIFSILTLYYCSDENNSNNSKDNLENASLNTMAKLANRNFNFTKGGDLTITNEEIIRLYQLCSNESDYSNIQKVMIYTLGNETGQDQIKVNDLQGLSFYKNKNGFLEHTFYKNNNGVFQEVENLKLKSSTVTMQQVDFVVQYTKLPKSQLTVYAALNLNYSNVQYEKSNDFNDFMILEFGSSISLKGFRPVEGIAPAEDKCGGCEQPTQGSCEFSFEPSQGWCEQKICAKTKIEEKLSNTANSQFFDDSKSYEIRDQLLSNSLFGHKYKLYYYHSSFSDLDFDLEQSIELASLIPKIHSAYAKYKSENSNEIIIDEEFATELITAIKNIKVKNNDKKYFVKILDNIIDDITFVKNKNAEEIKLKLY